jgi:dTDP-4-dehydrorhamnose reductase
MRVLVTGAGGMLAHAVLPALAAGEHTVAPFSRDALDVTRLADVRRAVRETRPDWVCHLAAMTDVDGCEGDPERAFLVNGLGSRNVAAAAADAGAAVLAVSSDYVFPGDDPAPRREYDPVGPLSVYGRSKLAGEEGVRELNPRATIVRTAWLYGQGGRNFVDTIRARVPDATREGGPGPLRVVDDQHGAPTWTADLAGALVALMERREFGTLHATNDGACTWHELACEICRQAGASVDVARISSAELARPARRPAYSVLHTGWLEHVLGRRLPHWRDALARYMAPSTPSAQSAQSVPARVQV